MSHSVLPAGRGVPRRPNPPLGGCHSFAQAASHLGLTSSSILCWNHARLCLTTVGLVVMIAASSRTRNDVCDRLAEPTTTFLPHSRTFAWRTGDRQTFTPFACKRAISFGHTEPLRELAMVNATTRTSPRLRCSNLPAPSPRNGVATYNGQLRCREMERSVFQVSSLPRKRSIGRRIIPLLL